MKYAVLRAYMSDDEHIIRTTDSTLKTRRYYTVKVHCIQNQRALNFHHLSEGLSRFREGNQAHRRSGRVFSALSVHRMIHCSAATKTTQVRQNHASLPLSALANMFVRDVTAR
jgi:hypothetical protein